MSKILVLPDSHVDPNKSLTRFKWLGELIVHQRPDYIVQLGDFLSLESLSHWDKNKRLLMEGRRYLHDIAAGKEAIKTMFTSMSILNDYLRRKKVKQYAPEIIWCMGNHEEWVGKYCEQHPELKDQLNLITDLGLDKIPNLEVVPYGHWKVIDGIHFTHAPIMGNGKPVSGAVSIAASLSLFDGSVVFGHTHRLESACTNRHGRTAIQMALSAGCFFEDSFEYCAIANNKFWRGVVILGSHGDGTFDYDTYSLTKLKALYG